MAMQDYSFEIKYRPGKENSNADCLSRLPIALLRSEDDFTNLMEGNSISQNSPYRFQLPFIKREGGELWVMKNNKRIKIPSPDSRHRITEQVHSLGHFGIRKTWQLLCTLFWWPGLFTHVKTVVRECFLCQRRKVPNKSDKALDKGVPFTAFHPMEVIAWDIMGPLPVSKKGNRFIVVVMDLFSRWLEIGALETSTAEKLAEFLWDRVISRFGPPVQVHSDKGTNFNAEVLKRLYQIWGIQKSTTVAYYPQGNGMVERMNKVIQDMVAKKLYDRDPAEWDELLAAVTYGHNVTPHVETGVSPYALFFGREPCIPVDGTVHQTSNDDKFQMLFQIWKKIQERWRKAHETEAFAPGDMVWLWRPSGTKGEPKKFSLQWTGPFRVLTRRNWGNYVLEDVAGGNN